MMRFDGLHTVFYQKKDSKQVQMPNGCLVWICPLCFEHNHFELPDTRGDCKTIIYEDELTLDGKLQSGNIQCMCHSKEHK
jgi:hypothetical protein